MNRVFLKDERDGTNHRLLLLLKKYFDLPFIRMQPIKKMVWLLSTKNQHWILKEFSTQANFKKQAAFTEELRKEGFQQTYSIHPKPFILEKRVFGLIDYIESRADSKVDYQQSSQIKEVLVLLEKYHHSTANISKSVKEQIPIFEQIKKWNKRLIDFRHSLPLHTWYPVHSYLNHYAEFGEWALEKMQKHAAFFTKDPHCIIHGDVASHNFIRDKKNQLWIIDFDLIAVAPAHIDYLQLSNRILPYLDWDINRLFSFHPLQSFKNTQPFLAALVYPTDIFREWLHFTRGTSIEQKRKWPMMENLLLNQFKQRMQMSREIMNKIDAL
ncbi:aminoglycoside phosphotransferase family protein [Lederbergia sp. NSJ-179]|uniref:phosphotransferase n=1 Tax=Lederbergia sp. NSJ-179 TaxID=2931402 RepID=UPI001FD12372|nr:phosphotransferase [Lederbergia sp. NSJ-179]MCJ7839914.1 aminoglycoside phosphotransferase family protein [Lederbergia sp. NSJ-179]